MEETRKFHLTDFLNNRLVSKIKLYKTSLCVFRYYSHSFHCKQSYSTLQEEKNCITRSKRKALDCVLYAGVHNEHNKWTDNV